MAGTRTSITESTLRDFASRSNGNYTTYASAVRSYLTTDAYASEGTAALMYSVWQTYQQSRGRSGSNPTPTSFISNTVDIFKGFEPGQYFSGPEQVTPRIEDLKQGVNAIKDVILSSGRLVDKAKALVGGLYKTAASGLQQYYADQTALLEKMNVELGMTGKLSEGFRNEITQATPVLLSMGIGMSEVANYAKNLVEQTGKFSVVNREALERAGEVARAYTKNMEELVAMYPEFQKIGVGAIDATEYIAKAGKSSLTLGLSAQKITKDLSLYIGKLNEYGFSNGIRGLERMVQRATEFRMNLQSVFDIAEKAFDPEKVFEMTANLQVLGGAVGDLNDPFKLMYQATNDMEGFQDAILKAGKGLATFDSLNNRFAITGVNLRIARERASALGMTLGDFTKQTIALEERAMIEGELMARGFVPSPEQTEFISNLVQIKDGKAVIQLKTKELQDALNGAKEIQVDEMTKNQFDQIKAIQEGFKELDEKDIVFQQATSIGNIERQLGMVLTMMRITAGRTIQTKTEDLLTGLGGNDVFKMKGFREFMKETTDFFRDENSVESKKLKAEAENTFKERIEEEIGPIYQFIEPLKRLGENLLNNNSQASNQTEENNSQANVIIHEHRHNVTSDITMDGFARYYSNRPELFQSETNQRAFT